MLDVTFRSTGDDNSEPQNVCGHESERSKDAWMTLSTPTLIKCVNDKDQSLFREARKFVDEINKESVFH